MRKDDLDLVNPLDPGGIPQKGNISVVVDGAESVHQILHGQAALAGQLGYGLSVFLTVIVNVHVTHIGTQIRNGLLGVLAGFHTGAVHVPDGGKPVVGELVQKVTKLCGACVGSGGFHQDGHRTFVHDGKKRA